MVKNLSPVYRIEWYFDKRDSKFILLLTVYDGHECFSNCHLRCLLPLLTVEVFDLLNALLNESLDYLLDVDSYTVG